MLPATSRHYAEREGRGAHGDTVSEPQTLTLHELNRATLARQLLLEREPIDPLTAIERLVSLQAQFAKPPYTGLWSRIEDFRRDQLTQLVIERKVVRATMMRHTLHLMSARDFARLRMTIQPALSRSFGSIAGKRTDGVDLDALVSTARVMVAESPRTFAEMRKRIAELEPGYDPSALGYAVRSFLPLVQVPSDGHHGFPGIPRYALAEDFLGAPLASADQLRELVLRYLAAFGPASVRDAQIWSGLSGLKQPVDELRSELTQFRDESGRELFDLPGAPRPSPDTPAPARLLPDYDNLMVAHADRTRVVSEDHRRRVSLPAAVVRATFLIDGFVAGTWKLERTAKRATLMIEPFAKLRRADRDELSAEAERLLSFLEPELDADLRFA